MSASVISNADMLEIQLRKWISKRHVENIKLEPAYSHPLVPKGQTVIAEVVDRTGQGLFFTGCGFTLPRHGFVNYDDIKEASWMSAKRGLVTPAATLPVTLVMLEAIRDYFFATGVRIGMKPAGGIRTAKQSLAYLVMVKETLGDDWLTPDLFRFGASTLVNDVLMQVAKTVDGNYQAADYFSLS